MNSVKFEIKRELKSSLVMGLTLAGLMAVFMLFYPAFKEEAEAFEIIPNNFPKEMLDSIGINIESLFSLEGFFSYVYTFISLGLGIYGMILGLNIVGREKMNQSLDFIYSKPASRWKIYSSKIVSGLVVILIVAIIMFVTLLFISRDQMTKTLFNLFISGFIIMFFFFGLGALVAVVTRRLRNPIGISTSVTFIFFILLMMARLLENNLMMNLTPFGYFEPTKIVMNELQTIHYAGFVVGVSLLIVIAGGLNHRKDVETV